MVGHYQNILGCIFKQLYDGTEQFPKYYKDHLRYSINDFTGTRLEYGVFNIENKEYKNNERETEVTELVLKYAVPFLEDISSGNKIKLAVKKYKDLKYQVHLALKEYLKIRR